MGVVPAAGSLGTGRILSSEMSFVRFHTTTDEDVRRARERRTGGSHGTREQRDSRVDFEKLRNLNERQYKEFGCDWEVDATLLIEIVT